MSRNKKGFSLAEVLITIAILAVLAGLAVVGVVQYMRSMKQLELDAVAKEIFIAAQNHLSLTESQEFLGLSDSALGTLEIKTDEDSGTSRNTGIYYFVKGDASSQSPFTDDDSSLIDWMLPFGSVDETVRSGSYIIRYQRSPAVVLDVFYTTQTGRYSHVFSAGDYSTVLGLKDIFDEETGAVKVSKKAARRDCAELGNAVVGWYGGQDLESGAKLKSPSLEVINKDKLTVKVTLKEAITGKESLKLIITGLSSKAKKAYDLYLSSDPRVSSAGLEYTFVLDDITAHDLHFAGIPSDIVGKSFYLGENISLQAKLYTTQYLTNVATSESKITNSLFDTATKVNGTALETDAVISSLRHLENLSYYISGYDYKENGRTSVDVKTAVQTTDLDWNDFPEGAAGGKATIHSLVSDDNGAKGYFRAIALKHSLSYNGGYHFISNLKIETDTAYSGTEDAGNAGLFASLISGSSVSNLELKDFDVLGTANAGTLAGTAGSNVTVTNVLARNSTGDVLKSVRVNTSIGNGNAGGLIGELKGGTVLASAAAVLVKATQTGEGVTTSAGGLIGKASGTVTGCYSAGHTADGSYDKWISAHGNLYDVSGTAAGGLIGSAQGANISECYSTCSVSGATAGGLVGQGGTITNCYCTGRVGETTVLDKDAVINNAFIGDAAEAAFKGTNHFFEIVNEVKVVDENNPPKTTDIVYKKPRITDDQGTDTVITALDETVDTYEAFVGSDWKPARPYDNKLTEYYHDASGSLYNLKTVVQLGAVLPGSNGGATIPIPENFFVNTHYGDWPAPEIFVINN